MKPQQLKNLQKVLKDYLKIKQTQEYNDYEEVTITESLLNWVDEELLKL